MNGTNSNPRAMQPIAAEQMPTEQLPMEQILDIYKKIIRELIGAFELDEESTDSEPLPSPIG